MFISPSEFVNVFFTNEWRMNIKHLLNLSWTLFFSFSVMFLFCYKYEVKKKSKIWCKKDPGNDTVIIDLSIVVCIIVFFVYFVWHYLHTFYYEAKSCWILHNVILSIRGVGSSCQNMSCRPFESSNISIFIIIFQEEYKGPKSEKFLFLAGTVPNPLFHVTCYNCSS